MVGTWVVFISQSNKFSQIRDFVKPMNVFYCTDTTVWHIMVLKVSLTLLGIYTM